jgi:hypothetical protein
VVEALAALTRASRVNNAPLAARLFGTARAPRVPSELFERLEAALRAIDGQQAFSAAGGLHVHVDAILGHM